MPWCDHAHRKLKELLWEQNVLFRHLAPYVPFSEPYSKMYHSTLELSQGAIWGSQIAAYVINPYMQEMVYLLYDIIEPRIMLAPKIMAFKPRASLAQNCNTAFSHAMDI